MSHLLISSFIYRQCTLQKGLLILLIPLILFNSIDTTRYTVTHILLREQVECEKYRLNS